MQIVERKSRSVTIDGIVDREVRARNFGGEEKRDKITGRTVNSPGYRNFLLYVTEEIAEELKDHGCEIKYTKVQGPNDVPLPYVSVTVSYYLKPVEAYMRSNGVVTPLDEAHIYLLNGVDIGNMCLVLEFGKEKIHNNGTRYIPLFASYIVADAVPNYIDTMYGQLRQAAVVPPVAPMADNGEVPFK